MGGGESWMVLGSSEVGFTSLPSSFYSFDPSILVDTPFVVDISWLLTTTFLATLLRRLRSEKGAVCLFCLLVSVS